MSIPDEKLTEASSGSGSTINGPLAVHWTQHRQDSPIKLSICIPTYNRGSFIGQTLESILAQANEAVEIVVADGASNDNTAQVIAAYQERFINIRYYRGSTNKGVDRDMATAVELAQGTYCWLMSSDDLLVDGAIARMLAEIESGLGVYLCNNIACTKEMKVIRQQRWLPRQYADRCFDLSNNAGLNYYFKAANTLGSVFSYISTIIFNRERWIGVEVGEEYYGTNYAHVYRLLSMLRKGGKIKYIDIPLVLCRLNNDSFSDKGLVHRYMIDFQGYSRIATGLFSNEQAELRKFLAVVRKEHRWYRLLVLRSHMRSEHEWLAIYELLESFGYERRLLSTCGFLGKFGGAISMAVRMRRDMVRIYGQVSIWRTGHPVVSKLPDEGTSVGKI